MTICPYVTLWMPSLGMAGCPYQLPPPPGSIPLCSLSVQEAAGASAAEVMPLMRKMRPRGLDCAHPRKVLNGILVVAPSGCKSWAQISVTPLL